MRRGFGSILFAVVFTATGGLNAGEPTLAEAEAKLAAMNVLARGHYADAKTAARAALGPILIVAADELILWRSASQKLEEAERVAYLPARYRHLKSLGHVPLGLWSLLAPKLGRSVAEVLPALALYRAQVTAMEPLIGTLGLRWDDAKRQREILSVTRDFIDTMTARGEITARGLEVYADELGPALLGNAYDAAEVQLAALHEIVQRWRVSLAAEEWNRLHVVVLGPNRPREAQPPYLYFQRLLGPAAATRLVSADNVTDVSVAVDLLVAAVNDRRLAQAFFNDSARLDRGLLSDATTRHLERLLGP